jgi:hypothetical protein
VKAKKSRIGRPPIAKKLHKDSLLSIRFTADERRMLEGQAKAEKLSTWARRVLLEAANPVGPYLLGPAQEPPSEQP